MIHQLKSFPGCTLTVLCLVGVILSSALMAQGYNPTSILGTWKSVSHPDLRPITFTKERTASCGPLKGVFMLSGARIKVVFQSPDKPSARFELYGRVMGSSIVFERNDGDVSVFIRANAQTEAPAGGHQSGPSFTSAASPSSIFVNGRPLTPQQIEELKRQYGAAAPPGRYWYDSRSGLYGFWGREAAGWIRPGHNFGSLQVNASGGNTDVFINGRQLNLVEKLRIQQTFGAVYPSRWWLDGRTGYVGIEGTSIPLFNLFATFQQAQRTNRNSSGHRWSDGRGNYGGADGGCVWASTRATSTSSGGSYMGCF